jgi:hypothetical protein
MKNKPNLLKLMIMFKNRPNHLYKYLMENHAFTDEFIKKTSMSSKLKSIQMTTELNFNNIDKMNEFFESLYFNDEEGHTKAEREKKWNQKLIDAIQNEDYEAASRIRDYMKKHNLKKY